MSWRGWLGTVALLVVAALSPSHWSVLAAFQAASAQPAPSPDALVGRWLGTVEVGGMRLRLLLKVTRGSDGTLAAKMDSLDQGARDLAVDEIRFDGRALTFAMKAIGGSYSGTFDAEGKRIAGTWRQGGLEVPLELRPHDGDVSLARPQDPKPPFPYEAFAVSYDSVPGVTISGTLTLPTAPARVPAVLLISGSGPQDRDEFLFGHRPFLVLADDLTRKGIGVLRVDDRGVGKSTGRFADATSEDFANDVAAGVTFLERHVRVDPARIGLVGHSEGGLIAPLVAARGTGVAFLVLLAAPEMAGAEVLLEQSSLIGRVAGMSDDAIRQNQELQRRIFEIVRAEPDADVRLTKIRESLANLPPAVVESQSRQASRPWFRFFLLHDPVPVLEKIKQPVLAMTGALDLQVAPAQNLGRIQQALERAGNRDVTIVTMAGLNHLFQTAQTGSVSEYSSIAETFAPAALDRISTWIASRVK